jgi:hypothetical protein
MLLTLVVPVGIRAQPYSPDARQGAVQRYWIWTAYWGMEGPFATEASGRPDFPLGEYSPNSTLSALVFWPKEDHQLGVCQSYFVARGNVVDSAHGIRMRRGESEHDAMRPFRLGHFESSNAPETQERLSVRPKARPKRSSGPEHTMNSVIGPAQGGHRSDGFDFVVKAQTVHPPIPTAPDAIRLRTSSREVERSLRAFLGSAAPRPSGPTCVTTVPLADEQTSMI